MSTNVIRKKGFIFKNNPERIYLSKDKQAIILDKLYFHNCVLTLEAN